MANPLHIDILRQGVDVWNKWRKENPEVQIDFSGTTLRGWQLNKIDFHGVKLREADLAHIKLMGANLSRIDLYGAFLAEAELGGANLAGASLDSADFGWARLNKSNLNGASLAYTSFIGTELIDTNLSKAHLFYTRFCQVNFNGANLGQSRVEHTAFEDVDLSVVKGLDTVDHAGPSTIGIDTIIRSRGNISPLFLQKAGIPGSIIEAIPSLVGSLKPIDYYTCFISHSSKDKEFVERLYADLQREGVHCWYAPEDLEIGDKIRPRIEESIRLYDKLLIVLSENSISSNWVAYEVERAINKEPAGIPNVLYPIRLDDAVKHCDTSWANDIRSTRNIGDFSGWRNYDSYQKAFNRLLRALKLAPQKQ